MQHTLSVKQERTLLMTLSGIQFSHILDFMIMMPLGPILIATFDITTHEFGLLVASYGFAAAISGLLVAAFVDKFERSICCWSCFRYSDPLHSRAALRPDIQPC